mmetsp:Transcript_28691/g.68004  ORF Transcript_28691/g.68004 Transcript_28691/m.68004 type:complete len:316 (+) Transcript_28691:1150-2097(+)
MVQPHHELRVPPDACHPAPFPRRVVEHHRLRAAELHRRHVAETPALRPRAVVLHSEHAAVKEHLAATLHVRSAASRASMVASEADGACHVEGGEASDIDPAATQPTGAVDDARVNEHHVRAQHATHAPAVAASLAALHGAVPDHHSAVGHEQRAALPGLIAHQRAAVDLTPGGAVQLFQVHRPPVRARAVVAQQRVGHQHFAPALRRDRAAVARLRDIVLDPHTARRPQFRPPIDDQPAPAGARHIVLDDRAIGQVDGSLPGRVPRPLVRREVAPELHASIKLRVPPDGKGNRPSVVARRVAFHHHSTAQFHHRP